jgi:aminotransferase in exopolysaccharide biosynthesis
MTEKIEISYTADQFLNSLRNVVGAEIIGLHEPIFNGNEIKYLTDAIESTYVSSTGPYIEKFEDKLKEYTGSKFVISVNSGTSGLHISLLLSGILSNDEVIVPALTFAATANAVMYCGAVPNFVDCETESFGIDPDKLRQYLTEIVEFETGLPVNKFTKRKIGAIIVMHTFGHPSKIEEIIEVAHQFNLIVIEDAAESMGSFYSGKHTGTFGSMGVLSFNGNKTITTGGGGAILTDQANLAHRARHLSTTAKLPSKWEFIHDTVGFNYRMPNLNAALGLAQLEQLEYKIERKRKLLEQYKAEFAKFPELHMVEEPSFARSNYWLQTIILPSSTSNLRDEILDLSNDSGVMTRPIWEPLSNLKHLSKFPKMDLSRVDEYKNRLINLPSNPKS